jgi:hypothetical protein
MAKSLYSRINKALSCTTIWEISQYFLQTSGVLLPLNCEGSFTSYDKTGQTQYIENLKCPAVEKTV